MFQTINEVKRSELLNISKNGSFYKDKAKGNRWLRKNNCKIANKVSDYNKIDMNSLWKDNVLRFEVKVQGETDEYNIQIQFSNLWSKMQYYLKQNKNKLDRDLMTKVLMDSLNSSDIKLNCSCPDFKYRLAFWASKNGFKSGYKELRPTTITNPNNSDGALCKHIIYALNNVSWLRNISSVIVNYINYCKENLEYNYSRFIFPKLFGVEYNKAVQLCLELYDEKGNLKNYLDSSEDLINLSNFIAKQRFKKRKI